MSKFHYQRRPIQASRHFKKFGDLHLFLPGGDFYVRCAPRRIVTVTRDDHKDLPVIRALSSERNARCSATNAQKCKIIRRFDYCREFSWIKYTRVKGCWIINCPIYYYLKIIISFYFLKIKSLFFENNNLFSFLRYSRSNFYKIKWIFQNCYIEKFTWFYRNSIDHIGSHRHVFW